MDGLDEVAVLGRALAREEARALVPAHGDVADDDHGAAAPGDARDAPHVGIVRQAKGRGREHDAILERGAPALGPQVQRRRYGGKLLGHVPSPSTKLPRPTNHDTNAAEKRADYVTLTSARRQEGRRPRWRLIRRRRSRSRCGRCYNRHPPQSPPGTHRHPGACPPPPNDRARGTERGGSTRGAGRRGSCGSQ